jgi:predicted nuclease of restriction endonuclease-like (RecB) superfamily
MSKQDEITDLKVLSQYSNLMETLKKKIRNSQLKAAVSVNREMIQLYWSIGAEILLKQTEYSWGNGVVNKIARDLQNSFPGIEGFSPRNIWRMRAFYKAYSDFSIVPQAVAELTMYGMPAVLEAIPWGHNTVLLEKLDSLEERFWYASMVIEEGWSRKALEDAINSKYFNRYGKAITNFKERLPEIQSQLAQEVLKDPYNFDFLELKEGYKERELEQGLIDQIQKFLIELGQGFAFVSRQYHLEVEGDDYYIDLLFYHLMLRCYCVVEIKTTDFKPEYAGKMNFYLSVVDELVKSDMDNPSIGLILCKTKKQCTAEYTLRDMNKPMGVSQYEGIVTKSLPQRFQNALPSVEEIETKLERVMKPCEHKKKSLKRTLVDL